MTRECWITLVQVSNGLNCVKHSHKLHPFLLRSILIGPKRSPGARKTARFRPPAGKTESTGGTAPKFRSFYPLELSGLMKKRPVFRRKSVFTRRRVRVGGAGGTKVPFRCNSLRRSTPLAQRAERSLRDLSSLWGQPARFARRLDNSLSE